MNNEKLGKVGLVGRFKPLHNAGFSLIEAACEKANEVIIGIGSCNKYNIRNPFTAQESEKMIQASLSPRFTNYTIIKIPDFAHIPKYKDGQKWKQFVLNKFGELDYFISANEFVRQLLQNSYPLLYPAEIIPKEKHSKLRATEVRIEIARFGNWKALVPEPVAEYLEKNGIADRFVKEFGLATLAKLTDSEYLKENAHAEKQHAQEA